LILVLFTSSYPYNGTGENTFLKEEIRYLADAFEKVVLIPRTCKGRKLPVPDNVFVVEGYSSFLKNPIKFFLMPQILTSNIFYSDLFKYPWILFHLSSFFRLIAFLAGAYLTRRWVISWIKAEGINIRECIFYTYWFDQAAMGIGMVKHIYPALKLVSRAHGYDLYEERYSPPYWPGRKDALEVVNALFPVSDSGTNYLNKRYPAYASRIETVRLGVANPNFINLPSNDGVLRIVSCSIISPIKRVDLLLEGIVSAARERPNQKFEWHHFGNGKTLLELQAQANAEFPVNAHAYFPGYLTHQALMDFYRNNPIDVFFNVSISEGVPVSIMEAISCGIPVIATDVGGNREIVTDKNGVLLSPNPSSQEITEAICFILENPKDAIEKRERSRSLWYDQYNAEKNFNIFIDRIKAVRAIGLYV
jgi:colanic acid/amylovoran biosynthesis glycosyltransferase